MIMTGNLTGLFTSSEDATSGDQAAFIGVVAVVEGI
jgi:hypothetical protein